MKTKGNTILVTGGGSGIGRELARRWAEAGNRVIVAGRRADALEETIGDREGMVSIVRRREGSTAPPLTDEIMGPIKAQAAKMWPGVPIAPLMTAGATDGRFLMNAGVPTYGLSGMFAIAYRWLNTMPNCSPRRRL